MKQLTFLLRLLCLVALMASSQLGVRSEGLGVSHPDGNNSSLLTPNSSLKDSLLSEVLVTDKRRLNPVIPEQSLSGKELEKMNVHSVADALRYFSGVQLKDYGGVGGIKTVNVRSMGSNHVGVFYDGIQLSNTQNGQVDLGMYSLDNMQSVSLFNGQKSQIFQSAKDFNSASSIYLRSRTPFFDEGETFHLKATLKAGSFDVVNPSILYEQKISDRVSASVNAEWMKSSGEYEFRYMQRRIDSEVAFDTTATRKNGDIEALRLEGGLSGRLNGGNWTMKAYHYRSERGVPGAIVSNVWSRGERIWDNNTFVQGSLRKTFGKRYQTQLLAKYAYYDTRYANHDGTAMQMDNNYYQHEAYVSSAHLYSLTEWWDVSAAYDMQWNKMNADLYRFAFPTRWQHYLSAATSASLGRLTLQGSMVMNIVDDNVETGKSPATETVYTPAFIASWQPLAECDLSLRAFAKRSFRMPTFNDLYYGNVGNTKLNPEHTTQYNIGVAYNSPQRKGLVSSWSVQADVYRNNVDDKIIAYPKGTQFRWTMLNLGRVEITGVDMSGNVTLCPMRDFSVTAKVQYTYQNAIDVTDPRDSYHKDQIPYIPHHSGSAVVQMQWRSWNLNYSYIYTGERYNQQENITSNRMQPWYTSDISLVKSFTWRNFRAKAMMEVNNLFDQDYEVILNYPMPKRNYRLTLSIEI